MHDLFTGSHVVSTPVAVTDLNPVDPLPNDSSSPRQQRVDPPFVARAIPEQSGTLVGRETELALLTTVLLRPDVRILMLTGPPGIGKTTVALALARRVADAFDGLVALAGPRSAESPDGVVAVLAESLGVLDSADSAPIDSLSGVLGERPALLVFDDLSAGIDDIARLSELLDRAKGLKLIVTARVPLGVPGECEFAVPALALPASDDAASLGTIEREVAVELFVNRARSVQPGFTLNLANAVAVAEICRRLQGVPLAIEVAAARSRVFPPQAMLARLGERLESTSPSVTEAPNLARMLASVIEWSVQTLDVADQQLFRTLGVFSGSFDAAAARALTDHEIDETTVGHQLDSLANAALVHRHGIDAGMERYHLPGPVWNVASASLSGSSAESDVRQRHATWFATMAHAAAAGLRTDRQHAWLGQLQTEVHNLRAALEWLYSSWQTDAALRMATDLSRFWTNRAGVSEGRAWLERGIAEMHAVAPATIAEARDAASWLVLLQGDLRTATELIEANLALHRSGNDRTGIATALDGLGELALSNGAFLDAERYFSESIGIWTACAADWNVAMSKISLGCVALNLNDVERASELFAMARAELDRLGDLRAAGVALLADAWLKVHVGAFADARDCFLVALKTFQEVDVVLETAEALEGLSAVAHADGDDDRASALLSCALLLRRDTGINQSFISRLGYLSERSALRATVSELIGVESWLTSRADAERCIADLIDGTRGHQ